MRKKKIFVVDIIGADHFLAKEDIGKPVNNGVSEKSIKDLIEEASHLTGRLMGIILSILIMWDISTLKYFYIICICHIRKKSFIQWMTLVFMKVSENMRAFQLNHILWR